MPQRPLRTLIRRIPVTSLALGLLCGSAGAAMQFPSLPDWESVAQGHYSTGAALRDLNNDGYPDLIVSNGNDMGRQPVVVYRNANGVFPATPTWTSGDIDYHGHLDLADVDGDGKLDLAVAVYLGAGGFSSPGKVKLYRGNGDGTFSSLPVWTCATPFYCFSVAFGDINMDGRPDLACAAGESYNLYKERFKVFRNDNGTLGTTPFWESADLRYALDVCWGDVNGDGILDLAFACESNPQTGDPVTYPSEVYFGTGTTLQTSPGWRSQDGHDYSNTIALGDLNGDGWLDLAIADNNQIHGGADYGRFKIFINNNGVLPGTPNWVSSFGGYGSNVSMVDADADGDLDLAAGSWWGPVRIYQNDNGAFATTPAWQSSTGSVVENIAWDDIDNDGQTGTLHASFAGDGSRRLFTLPHRQLRVSTVLLDGVALPRTSWCPAPEMGWVVVAPAPPAGADLRIDYASSIDFDCAVSNWDSNIGNYVFYNQLSPTGAGLPVPDGIALQLAPNPARDECRIALAAPVAGETGFAVVDVGGRVLFSRQVPAGAAGFIWDGRDANGRAVPAGTYWIQADRGQARTSARLVVVR